MDIHYNAFISYRHHPDDIRVATQVHRALERYHIPKAVRKKQNGPLKLFRDKDELPITSNLSDDIYQALRNSDFLIVICSTHTKESMWVQREIETFLQTHSHDKVLTVLVDGEPYDTIPEILQYREETDPITGETVRVPIEPLSCDWRVSKKVAHREELPRLAAALLHCGYDELRQRQRQYKMRRLMTVLSAATVASLALMCYFLYTSIIIQKANDDLNDANREIRQANVQIQRNLDEALRNQSEYLASAAKERYEAGDRLTAISLAMAALPSEADPRPYVPDAEAILAEALRVYDPSWDIVASAILDCGALVVEFAVNEDGTLLYALDKADRITVWDVERCEKRAVIPVISSKYQKMQMVGENLIVQSIMGYESGLPELCCYSPDGALLWSVEECYDFALVGEETVLVMDNSVDFDGVILSFLDPVTGTERRERTEISSVGEESCRGFCRDRYEPGSTVTLEFGNWNEEYVYLYHPDDGAVERINPFALWEPEQQSDLSVLAVSTTPEGNILVMVSDGSGAMNGQFSNMFTTSPATAWILCFRGEDLSLAWRQQILSYSYGALRTMEVIPGTDQILCQKDNVFYVLDSSTGQLLSTCEALANVCSIDVTENGVSGILENGSRFTYDPVDNECSALQLMDGNIVQAETAGVHFTLESISSHITVYRTAEKPEWTVFDDSTHSYIRWSMIRDHQLLSLHSSGELQLLDLRTDKCVWRVEELDDYSMEPLGFSADGTEVYIQEHNTVQAFDLATGDMRTLETEQDIDGSHAATCSFACAAGDQYCYLLKTEETLYLALMDLKTGEAAAYPFREALSDEIWSVGLDSGTVCANEDFVWAWIDGGLYEFCMENQSFRLLVSELAEYPLITYHEAEGLLSVGSEDEILFFKPGEAEPARVPINGHKPVSVYLRGSEVLVITAQNQLLRLGTDGTLLAQTDLTVYTSFYSSTKPDGGKRVNIDWYFAPDGVLILNVDGICNIIDCEAWALRGYVQSFKAYDAHQDRLICYIDSAPGSFPRYSTDQVMGIALEQLNGYTLPEETKEYYGID